MQAVQVLGEYLKSPTVGNFARWMFENGIVSPVNAIRCANSLRHWCQVFPQLNTSLSTQRLAHTNPLEVDYIPVPVSTFSIKNKQKLAALLEGSMSDKPVTSLPGINNDTGAILELEGCDSVSEQNVLKPQKLNILLYPYSYENETVVG